MCKHIYMRTRSIEKYDMIEYENIMQYHITAECRTVQFHNKM